VDRWARRTTRARNDLAHEGKTPNHSVEELIAVVEMTTAVLILNVLHELGLPAERQRDIVPGAPAPRGDGQHPWQVAGHARWRFLSHARLKPSFIWGLQVSTY
jgi:hypothetical protein